MVINCIKRKSLNAFLRIVSHTKLPFEYVCWYTVKVHSRARTHTPRNESYITRLCNTHHTLLLLFEFESKMHDSGI